MRILFIYPPARDASVPPLGIGYLCSFLRLKGHETEVLDLTANPVPTQELRQRIVTFNKYDCIGISAIVTAYSFVKNISKDIKDLFPDLPVIIGNTISISCPKTLLENSKADVVVVDEGEQTLLELLENIKNPSNFKNIKGIWYKDRDGNINSTPPRNRIHNLDSLSYPAWDLLNIAIYMRNTGSYLDWGLKTGWISAVRGCPFRCGYCSRGFGQFVVARSANSIIDEMIEFRRLFRATHFHIIDDLFMVNKEMIRDFSRSLIQRRLKITWQCAGRVNFADEDLFRLMKKAGCICIGYGIESGSHKILNNMNKATTVEQAKKAIRLTRKAGIEVKTPFMFGYIGEDKDTISETLSFIKDMRLGVTRLFFSTPYPNTPLYNWAKNNNRIKYDDDTYLSLLGNNAETFLVNLTDFRDEELLKLKKDLESKLQKTLPFKIRLKRSFYKINYIKARMLQLGIRGTIAKFIKKLRG